MKTGTRIKGMIGAACIAVMIAALAGTGGTQKVSADGVTDKPACQPVTGIEQRKETIALRKAESARIHQQEAERRAAEEAARVAEEKASEERAQAKESGEAQQGRIQAKIVAQKQGEEASQPTRTKKAYALTSSHRKSVTVNRYQPERRTSAAAGSSSQAKAPSNQTDVQPNGIRYAWTSLGNIEDYTEAARMVRIGLVEYRSNYFAADISTSVGKQIRSLRKGDIITVGGRKISIDGEVYGSWITDSIGGIQARVRQAGYGEAVCFQTCIPPLDGSIVIKCGHYI